MSELCDCVSTRMYAHVQHGGYLSDKTTMRIDQNTEMRDIDRERFRPGGRVFLFGLSNLSSLGIEAFSVDRRKNKNRSGRSICDGLSRNDNLD